MNQEPSDFNALPAYIPAHLQGKVQDFRKEPDGSVSFEDNANPSGLSGTDMNRTNMSPDEYKKTFDRGYFLRDPMKAINEQYMSPESRIPLTSAQKIQRTIGSGLGKAWDWGNSSTGKSVMTTGLLAALAGGGLGAYRAMRDDNPESSGPIGRGLLYALMAGTAGAGLTAFLQNRASRAQPYAYPFSEPYSKQASAMSGNVLVAIANDPSLSQAQRAAIIETLQRMPTYQRQETFLSARQFAGVGVGIAIARVLAGKGLLPSMIGGMLGLALASGGRPSAPKNKLGQFSI